MNPAKLIAGLARHLPENVTVYHQTPALAMRQENGGVRVTTLQGTIRADQAMLATNALSRELAHREPPGVNGDLRQHYRPAHP